MLGDYRILLSCHQLKAFWILRTSFYYLYFSLDMYIKWSVNKEPVYTADMFKKGEFIENSFSFNHSKHWPLERKILKMLLKKFGKKHGGNDNLEIKCCGVKIHGVPHETLSSPITPGSKPVCVGGMNDSVIGWEAMGKKRNAKMPGNCMPLWLRSNK